MLIGSEKDQASYLPKHGTFGLTVVIIQYRVHDKFFSCIYISKTIKNIGDGLFWECFFGSLIIYCDNYLYLLSQNADRQTYLFKQLFIATN